MSEEGGYPYPVVIAASLLGCEPGELMSWKVLGEPNRVVVIAPSGQKYTFSEAEIMAAKLPAAGVVTGTALPASDIDQVASPLVTEKESTDPELPASVSPKKPAPKKPARPGSKKK